MEKESRKDKEVSAVKQPAPTPLVSAEDRPAHKDPVYPIPEEQLYPIHECARDIANNSYGSVENHRTGKVGEYAVAEALGVRDSIDFEIYTDGGDGGFDLTYKGAKIDVKTVGEEYSDPALPVPKGEPLRADYYVLASRVSKTDVRLIGYAPRWFVANTEPREYNGGRYHLIEQEYLFPFPRFF